MAISKSASSTHDHDDQPIMEASIDGAPLLEVSRDRITLTSGLTTFEAFCVSINYIVGTGIFSLPFAFYKAGLVFGTVALVASSFVSYICLTYVIEVISRCEAISRKNDGRIDPLYSISSRSWEFTKMCSLLHSNVAKNVCQALMCAYCYGALWSYGNVFASSLVTIVYNGFLDGQCDFKNHAGASCYEYYLVALALYASIVITMSLLDMKEQAFVQICLTIYRFAAFAIMLTTVFFAMLFARPSWPGASQSPPYISNVSGWNWSGYSILTTSAVALTIHYNFPDIVTAMETRSSASVKRVSSSAFGTVSLLYMIVGIVCSLFFGEMTQPLVTLNWSTYTGPSFAAPGDQHEAQWYAIVLRTLIVAFPILDMVSVFPLVVLSLSSNLIRSAPARFTTGWSRTTVKRIARLVAALPPLLLATIQLNLNEIFQLTGLVAFFLEMFIPLWLVYISRHRCRQIWSSANDFVTPYGSVFSGPIWFAICLLFALLSISLALGGLGASA